MNWILGVLSFLFFVRAALPHLTNSQEMIRLQRRLAPKQHQAWVAGNTRAFYVSLGLGLWFWVRVLG